MATKMKDRPLKRKYSRIERERRFLLDRLPDATDSDDFVRLCDTFIDGVYLRIRRVERPDGTEVLTKLGQKILDRDAPDDPTRREMTTIYLAPGQADHLKCLDGPQSVKRRYKVEEQGWTFMIDVWEAPTGSAGLVLAEVECPSDAELAKIAKPTWAAREVTSDPNYSAFTLAHAPDA
jgi:CYTH domain-containing protein